MHSVAIKVQRYRALPIENTKTRQIFRCFLLQFQNTMNIHIVHTNPSQITLDQMKLALFTPQAKIWKYLVEKT